MVFCAVKDTIMQSALKEFNLAWICRLLCSINYALIKYIFDIWKLIYFSTFDIPNILLIFKKLLLILGFL